MENRDIILSFFDAVWARRDPDAAAAYFKSSAEVAVAGSDLSLRPEDFTTLAQTVQMLIEDTQWDVLNEISDGPWISCLLRCRAVASRSGQRIEVFGQIMARIEDGKFVEAYNHFDMISFFSQLGLLPPAALENALAGAQAA